MNISDIFQRIILVAASLLAIFLITYHFTESPRVWIDEGVFTEIAKNLAWHGKQGIQIAPDQIISSSVVSTSGYPLIFPVAASFRIFGTGLWQARLPMVIYMISLVIAFYLFIKKRHGFYWAIFSVLLLLSFSPFYGNGRPVQGEVPGLALLMFGALIFLYWEEGLFADKRLAAFSGILFGLSAAAKPIFLIILAPSLIISFFIFLKKESDKLNSALFFSGFAVPVIAWLFIQFTDFNSLIEAFSAYAMAGYANAGVSAWTVMAGNLRSFFTETTPALFLASLIFSSSVFIYFYAAEKKMLFKFSELILLIFSALNWLAYLKGPSWYRHFFPAQILALLLSSSAFAVLYGRLSGKLLKRVAIFLAVSVILLQFYHLFFLSQNSPLDRSNQNILLEGALGGIGLEKNVLIHDSIAAAIFLPHDNYFQYVRPTNYLEFGNKAMENPLYDYILTRNEINAVCYEPEILGKYYLYERKSACR